MKKTVIILAAILGFSLAACSQGNNKKENKITTQTTETQEKKEMKTLIVYFSATGNTKAAAQQLAKEFMTVSPLARTIGSDVLVR